MFSEIDSRTKTGGSICLLLTIISCYLTSQTDSLSLNGSTWLNIFAFFAIISSITANKKWSKRNSQYVLYFHYYLMFLVILMDTQEPQ